MTNEQRLMKAQLLRSAPGTLELVDRAVPVPGSRQVLIRVEACGVCRTDVHLVDGELPMAELPVVPGHQIVGVVEATGREVERLSPGDRVGVPWLGRTCGECERCRTGRENLCEKARFTGCQIDGGFAELAVADERFVFELPASVPSVAVAPLLCAGLIGLRTLRKAGDARDIGIYGFGSAAHIVTQIAIHEGRRVFAFVRKGDEEGAAFARRMGAVWAGSSLESSPEPLDAALIFAPVGSLVPAALGNVKPGGRVVCGGIHMTTIPAFPYELLWGERVIESVANLTRADGEEMMNILRDVPLRTEVTTWPLSRAGDAIDAVRSGRVEGSAVLEIDAR